jgi:lambda family phage minor tail protein L
MPVPASPLLQTQHNAIIELFDLDLSPIGTNSVLRFCNESNGAGSVVWRGFTYSPVAIQCTGFEYNGKGQLPIPQLTIGNTLGAITSLMLFYGDLVGSKITRHRVFANDLDGMPGANPNNQFEDDIYFIDRKVSEDKLSVVFSLASALDLEGFNLPSRVITSNACTWLYRGAECGYTGPPVADLANNPTTSPLLDNCGKQLSSCKLRFGAFGVLPFGGFPGVDSIND